MLFLFLFKCVHVCVSLQFMCIACVFDFIFVHVCACVVLFLFKCVHVCVCLHFCLSVCLCVRLRFIPVCVHVCVRYIYMHQ